MKEELAMECDYSHELTSQQRYKKLIQPIEQMGFYVPDVIPELSTKRILTSEFVKGEHLDKV